MPSRFLAGLLIFLGAFLIGMYAVRLVTQRQAINVLETPSSAQSEAGSCYSPDGVEIEVAHINGHRTPWLNIINSGAPIYFYPYDVWVRGKSSPFEYPLHTPHQSDAFQEIEIPSGSNVYLPLKSIAPVEAIFRYRVGERRIFRSFAADLTLGCQ